MKEEAKAKAAITKKMNQLAGVRLPLPGQNCEREAAVRSELVATFKPVDAAEMLWLNDIAYCTATMDVIRAQISGLWMRVVEDAHALVVAAERPDEFGDVSPATARSQTDRDALAGIAERKFVAPWGSTFLNQPVFASLLARADRRQIETLRLLQAALHEEAKERDRIINQLERRRRNAMRDAIELAEEARRAEVFRNMTADQARNPMAIEDASFELIEGDGAEIALESFGRPTMDAALAGQAGRDVGSAA